MNLKDEQSNDSHFGKTRKLTSIAALAVLVIGGAIAIKAVSPTSRAEAQLLRNRPRTQSRPQVRKQPARQPKGVQAQQRNAANDKKPAVSGTDIAAVVNDEIITRQALGRECLKRWGEETLESLVNKHLITQACRDRGILISDQLIEDEINRIATKFGLTKDHWLKMLKSERNVSAEQYRRDIIWPTLALKALAANKLTVTEEQLKQEYESEYGPKVQVSMISLESAAKAKQIQQMAKEDPASFGALAKKYSRDTTSASARGRIPPVRRHMGEPAIEKAVFELEQGEVSEVVQAANQYFIFKCEKHIPAGTISGQFRQQAMTQLRERIMERNLRDASDTYLQGPPVPGERGQCVE